MLGMSERQLMRHVYWPSALSWMFSSLHTSVGFAVVGAVVGEYLGSAAGLGYLIQQAEGVFDVAGVFAGMFVLSAFVILIDIGVTLVERRLLVWRPARRRGGGRLFLSFRGARSANPETRDRFRVWVAADAHPGMTRQDVASSVQQLDVIRRLRRCLDRDRLDRTAVRLGAAMRRCPWG